METKKPFYKSKTEISLVIGFVALLLSQILPSFGVPTEQAGQVVAEESSQLAETILTIVAALSYFAGFAARLVAKDELTITKSAAKTLIIFVGAVVLLVGVSGCVNPLYEAEHRQLINRQAAIVGELDERCADGDEQACREGLSQAAETLRTLAEEY